MLLITADPKTDIFLKRFRVSYLNFIVSFYNIIYYLVISNLLDYFFQSIYNISYYT